VAALSAVLLGLFRMELTSRRLFRSDLEVAARSQALAREHDQVQRLMRNILPTPIATRLRSGEDTIADDIPDASVLFADLTGFTALAHDMAPADVVRHLDELFTRFDVAAERAGVEKIKTIGDAYMAVGGIPRVDDGSIQPTTDHPEHVVALGLELIGIVDRYATETGLPFALRVGVHTGPLVAGVIGTHRFQYDLWGDTVNVASRLEGTGIPGTVQVARETHARTDGHYLIERRGLVLLDGVGMTETWLVRPPLEPIADH
jgi:class 3 adenylate cyclase